MAQQLGSNYYNSPFKFNGKELDEETGFYYYGARYYDPKISIWLSVDPLAEQFPNFNPYNYVMQNPLNLIDPTGMSPDPPTEDGTEFLQEHTDDKTGDTYIWDNKRWLKTSFNLNNVTIVGVKSTGKSFVEEGRSRLQMPAEYQKNGDIDTVISKDDWISQFTQPRPNVACKRTCDLIAGFSPLNKAVNVGKENNNKIQATKDFDKGISLIDSYLLQGKPITVGVHHTFNAGYNEGTTDHFVVIVGKGSSNNKVYYNFYDVATKYKSLGTSPLNRLYLQGDSVIGNTAYTKKRTYTLTQVRPN